MESLSHVDHVVSLLTLADLTHGGIVHIFIVAVFHFVAHHKGIYTHVRNFYKRRED